MRECTEPGNESALKLEACRGRPTSSFRGTMKLKLVSERGGGTWGVPVPRILLCGDVFLRKFCCGGGTMTNVPTAGRPSEDPAGG